MSIKNRNQLFEPIFDRDDHVIPFDEMDLHRTWHKRIREDNDFIVCVAPSSTTEMSGTGKTTFGIQAARKYDLSDDGWNADAKASLNSDVVAQTLYPDLPDRSAILFDEAQGTLDSHGVDNRRAMADAVVKMSRSAAQHRWKQMTLVIITQSTRWIDSRMMDIIDRLVLIQEKNHRQKWARAVVFDHYFDDLGDGKQEFTPAVEDVYWSPIPETDPDYRRIEEMKREARGGGDSESESELPDERQREIAQDFRNIGKTPRWIAENIDSITYSYSWIYEHTDSPDNKPEVRTA